MNKIPEYYKEGAERFDFQGFKKREKCMEMKGKGKEKSQHIMDDSFH